MALAYSTISAKVSTVMAWLASHFSADLSVSVTSTSKGRGFSGVMKRWGFSGGPRTHGQSDRERAPGSIGQGTDPGRVHKGKKMPGHYGHKNVNIKNIQILHIDEDNQQIFLSGPVPGAINTVLTISKIRSSKAPQLLLDSTPIEKESKKEVTSKEETTAKKETKTKKENPEKEKETPKTDTKVDDKSENKE